MANQIFFKNQPLPRLRKSGHRQHSMHRGAYVGLLLAGVALIPLTTSFLPSAWAAVTDGSTAPNPVEQTTQPPAAEDQVGLLANSVSYDEVTQTITAEGSVEITQNDKVVRANQVVYHLQTETVEAVGDVAMMDSSGDVHFAERVELEKQLSNGYIKKLRSILADGSRISADEGRRTDGNIIVMKNATYTPCEPCREHPEKSPLWQITADKVTHDKQDHSISYEDAKLEIYGVPVAYTPYFSHPDGTIKQKSGVLPPKFSLNSQLGLGVTSQYYWAISPSEDATIGARVFTGASPQLLGEYRKRFEKAKIKFNASTTYSDRKESVGNTTITTDKEMRGHLFGDGLWDLDDKWRAGFKAQITSDEQYLRQYDITSKDVLENEIYAERFEHRDYLAVRALGFQDVRVSDRSTDQPNILPEFEASYLGDPNSLLGGRWSADLFGLGLMRKGNGQDVARMSTTLGWQRRDIFSWGFVNVFNASARGDYYSISDRDEISLVGGSGTTNAARFYPLMHDALSYPLEKDFDEAQMVIAPTVSVTLSTNAKNDTGIPNEDSQDVQIDALNIFDSNRFPGIDRVEDRSHVTYGARTGLYQHDGDSLEVFLGQSLRFENGDNPFPNGSGLSEQKSDIVGQMVANYRDRFTLNYAFQLGSDSLRSERHELDATTRIGNLGLSATYLYARALEGTDLNSSREQLYGDASYQINPEWTLNSAARYDFGSEDEGLRYADLGVIYTGQCVSVTTRARRNFTFEDTGDNATEITVSLGLKNLGTFGNNN
ncbi:MAG TPA: LPS-assembly protein LptD [Candidatus Marinimicrobia bacterium]|nr:LPS-assembly protein LptD [Candidatus Neomarinimicrobiota bacterium]